MHAAPAQDLAAAPRRRRGRRSRAAARRCRGACRTCGTRRRRCWSCRAARRSRAGAGRRCARRAGQRRSSRRGVERRALQSTRHVVDVERRAARARASSASRTAPLACAPAARRAPHVVGVEREGVHCGLASPHDRDGSTSGETEASHVGEREVSRPVAACRHAAAPRAAARSGSAPPPRAVCEARATWILPAPCSRAVQGTSLRDFPAPRHVGRRRGLVPRRRLVAVDAGRAIASSATPTRCSTSSPPPGRGRRSSSSARSPSTIRRWCGASPPPVTRSPATATAITICRSSCGASSAPTSTRSRRRAGGRRRRAGARLSRAVLRHPRRRALADRATRRGGLRLRLEHPRHRPAAGPRAGLPARAVPPPQRPVGGAGGGAAAVPLLASAGGERLRPAPAAAAPAAAAGCARFERDVGAGVFYVHPWELDPELADRCPAPGAGCCASAATAWRRAWRRCCASAASCRSASSFRRW